MTPLRLGSVGVWSGGLQRRPTTEALAVVAELEALDYRAVWIPESPAGKDVLTFAAVLLGSSRSIVVATGIANIWVRDPVAMMNAARTLSDAYPGRFVLGVGVSHRSTCEMRGHTYEHPLAAMRDYLMAMSEAPFDGHPPQEGAPRLVAALGPRMTTLAGELADGVHPLLSTPEHTRSSRQTLGAAKTIAVEQGVILATEPETARAAARQNLRRFLAWPSYRAHFRRLGFDEADLSDGGSDALIDALYAWGDTEAIRARISDHLSAGADHVCLQAIPTAHADELDTLRALAPQDEVMSRPAR
jgi:probable F420-dependent oxidoreductase